MNHKCNHDLSPHQPDSQVPSHDDNDSDFDDDDVDDDNDEFDDRFWDDSDEIMSPPNQDSANQGLGQVPSHFWDNDSDD